MSSPKTRVEEEIVLLDEKISKLTNFITDPASDYKSLSKNNKSTLEDQLSAMHTYAAILKEHLRSWED